MILPEQVQHTYLSWLVWAGTWDWPRMLPWSPCSVSVLQQWLSFQPTNNTFYLRQLHIPRTVLYARIRVSNVPFINLPLMKHLVIWWEQPGLLMFASVEIGVHMCACLEWWIKIVNVISLYSNVINECGYVLNNIWLMKNTCHISSICWSITIYSRSWMLQ